MSTYPTPAELLLIYGGIVAFLFLVTLWGCSGGTDDDEPAPRLTVEQERRVRAARAAEARAAQLGINGEAHRRKHLYWCRQHAGGSLTTDSPRRPGVHIQSGYAQV